VDQNINTVVIVLGGPFLASFFTRLRARGWMVDLPQQFALSLVLMGVGFLCLRSHLVRPTRPARSRSCGCSSTTCCRAWANCSSSPIG